MQRLPALLGKPQFVPFHLHIKRKLRPAFNDLCRSHFFSKQIKLAVQSLCQMQQLNQHILRQNHLLTTKQIRIIGLSQCLLNLVNLRKI